MPEQKSIRIKPILTVICDDVRVENNGKPLILGIYTAGITLNERHANLPTQAQPLITLALWIAYEVKEAGRAEVEFQVIAPNPERRIKIKAVIAFDKVPPDYEIPSLTFTGLMVPIEDAGDIQILFRHQADDEWQTLRRVPVIFNPVTASNETEQLS